MKIKLLIIPPMVVLAALAVYAVVLDFRQPDFAGPARRFWDHYLTNNARNRERQFELMGEMRPNQKWWSFYGERPAEERRTIFKETRGLDDLGLIRYVGKGGLRMEMELHRFDVIRDFMDIDERIGSLDSRIENASTPSERVALLQIRDEFRKGMRSWAAKYRETINLYRAGEADRFSPYVFWQLPEAKGIPAEYQGEAYFKWRAEGGAFHRFLCWTSHQIRREKEGRVWGEIKDGWSEWQDAELVESRDYPNLSRYRYQLSPIGWIGRDGLRHEWFYEFEVDRRDPAKVLGAKPGFVMVAKSGLSAAPNERYAKFIKREVYPKGSVLDLVLRRDEVKAAAKKAPVLKRVEVGYDVLRDHNLEQQPQGFSVVVDLVDSLKSEDVGRRLHFFVPSGLDSPLGVDGQPVERDYLPEDTLGEVRYLGGSEWGS